MRPVLALIAMLAATATAAYASQSQSQRQVEQHHGVAAPAWADKFHPATGNRHGGPQKVLDSGDQAYSKTDRVGAEALSGEGSGSGGGKTLMDMLAVERKGGIWWEYARDVSGISPRLSRAGSTTLLVPVDSAVSKMAHKPHQNADGSASSEEDVKRNVERFISAHIVPAKIDMPIKQAETLLSGFKVDVSPSADGDGWIITPGDVPVLSVKEASNGRILYLDGVLPF